jgi:hypothetical protein
MLGATALAGLAIGAASLVRDREVWRLVVGLEALVSLEQPLAVFERGFLTLTDPTAIGGFPPAGVFSVPDLLLEEGW